MAKQRLRIMHLLVIVMLAGSVFPTTGSLLAGKPATAAALNLIRNGSFEEGTFAPLNTPDGWQRDLFEPSGVLTWDDTQAHAGGRSVKIEATALNDARWIQPVAVQPHTLYQLSGWIKTVNVTHSLQAVDAGANLALMGEWTRTTALIGTNDWSYVSLLFNTGARTEVTIAARLGFWSGTTTGTAWFDDLQLTPFTPSGPHPNWQILVLIYEQIDFTYTDRNGVTRQVVATISADEKARAAESARLFVEQDIPALNSGNMIPTITIRYPDHALSKLSPFGDGWSPAPQDTVLDRDAAFDSVIVIWDPRVTDVNSGEALWIGGAAGLTYGMGSGQTYFEMIIEGAAIYNHRNVFRHEWGHAILGYYDAIGVTPQPTVTNHADPSDYVHCPTGKAYVWQDETLDNLIPNSIYNNESGFTHDYYSGSTATPDQPTRCLGITPLAWATGGPVSKPSGTPAPVRDLLLSSSSSGKVQGIKFNDEDILRYALTTGTWQMFFDGSDVGIRGDVNALAVTDTGTLLLSFNNRQTLPSVGEVDDADIVEFIPSALGAKTAGTFAWYLDGSSVKLTTDGEDIDAIALVDNGLLISTIGDIDVQGAEGKDEDLLLFHPNTLGKNTTGTWSFYFDGSAVGLNKGSEDITGVWVDPMPQGQTELYLSTRGNFSVAGLKGDKNDLFRCTLTASGAETQCTFEAFWDGDSAGFGNEQIDAFTLIDSSQFLIHAATLDDVDSSDEEQEPDSEDADDDLPEKAGTETETEIHIYLPTILQ